MSDESQIRSDVEDKASENTYAYWRANVSLIRIILLIWALASFGMAVLFMSFFKDVTSA